MPWEINGTKPWEINGYMSSGSHLEGLVFSSHNFSECLKYTVQDITYAANAAYAAYAVTRLTYAECLLMYEMSTQHITAQQIKKIVLPLVVLQ